MNMPDMMTIGGFRGVRSGIQRTQLQGVDDGQLMSFQTSEPTNKYFLVQRDQSILPRKVRFGFSDGNLRN